MVPAAKPIDADIVQIKFWRMAKIGIGTGLFKKTSPISSGNTTRESGGAIANRMCRVSSVVSGVLFDSSVVPFPIGGENFFRKLSNVQFLEHRKQIIYPVEVKTGTRIPTCIM